MVVKIYTDGACRGNPGPGGWGVVLLYGEHEKNLSGNELDTTNNRMELTAAIKGISALTKSCKVEIFTDSVYVKNGITEWIHKWRSTGWLTANKKPVKNQDLWQELDKVIANYDITWRWVKGHNGDKYNEKADLLATSAIDELLVERKRK